MDLVQVRALVARGRYLQALAEARRLGSDPSLPLPDRVDALLLAVRCASLRGLHAEAYQHAAEARGMACAAGDAGRMTLADLYAGAAALEAGDWQAAETHLLGALARIDGLPNLAGQRAMAYYQLAVAYERQHRHEAALALYQQAADLFHKAGDARRALWAHHNAAWLLIRLGRTADAALHLDAATLLLPEGEDAQRANHVALEAAALLAQGRREEAIQAAEEVLLPGYPGARPWSRACAAWVAGQVALAEGRPDLAQVMVRVAAKEAPDCQDAALVDLVGDLSRQLVAAG